jgi:hypothetical protein
MHRLYTVGIAGYASLSIAIDSARLSEDDMYGSDSA